MRADVAVGDRQPLRRPAARPGQRADDPRRRRHRHQRHDQRGRPRRAVQHAQRADPQGPSGRDPGVGVAVRRARAGRRRPAWQYLNPAVASSSALFARAQPRHGPASPNFIVKSSKLVADVAQRSSRPQRAGRAPVDHHPGAGRAADRARAVDPAPAAVHAAGEHDVRQPAQRARRPDAAGRCDQAGRAEARRSCWSSSTRWPRSRCRRSATWRTSISRPGPDNDLIDLTKLGVPLAAGAPCRNVEANGKLRPGAFPESTIALNDFTPELATARPYAVDLTGWFEGYSHPGTIDANGGVEPGRGRRRRAVGRPRAALLGLAAAVPSSSAEGRSGSSPAPAAG